MQHCLFIPIFSICTGQAVHATHSLNRVIENAVMVLYQTAASDPVPESPEDAVLAPILQTIFEKNAKTHLGDTDTWQTVFTPAESQCFLCEAEHPLMYQVPMVDLIS